HNVSNALSTIAVADILEIPLETIKTGILSFTGTNRRFQYKGERNGFTIIDDYAHHPTEIKATLSAAQNMPHNRLWCLFQPHTYTRTMALFNEFAGAFNDADILVMAEIYAAREKNIYKISSKSLVEEINKQQPEKEAIYIPTLEEIAAYVKENVQPGDVVITMGAGDIFKVAEMLMA
ncbi:MAG: UDP-N-acetylmuramate--L-alanine ligase, partial [Firmicutes bacterium]|nr:UDP-N-acetylmuramate--L-alanine ligase [Bacillota bacterium]